MVASFIVPGSLRLKDVQRPAKDETPAQRLHRLAQKATIEGAYVARIGNADRLFAVSSRRGGDLFWLVDASAGTCGCEGFGRFGVCGHLALVLAELGELPDPMDEVARIALHDQMTAARIEVERLTRIAKTTADYHNLDTAKRRLWELTETMPAPLVVPETTPATVAA